MLMPAYSIVPPGATTYRAGMVRVQPGAPLKAARAGPQPSWTARSSSEAFQRRPNARATLPPLSTRLAKESPLLRWVSRPLPGVCCETATLDVKTWDGIALAVSEADGCDYCLAARSYISTNLAKIPPEEI